MEGEYWRCKKCQSMFKVSILTAMETKACPYCQEPSLELFDLDRSDWSTPVIVQGEEDGT